MHLRATIFVMFTGVLDDSGAIILNLCLDNFHLSTCRYRCTDNVDNMFPECSLLVTGRALYIFEFNDFTAEIIKKKIFNRYLLHSTDRLQTNKKTVTTCSGRPERLPLELFDYKRH